MDDILSTTPGLTVEAYAKAKELEVTALARWGVVTVPNPYHETSPAPCVALPYRDLNGNLVRTKYRTPTGTCWDKREGVPLTLYGLWHLPRVPADRLVVLVEGESDCHAAWMHGIMALGLPSNSTWRKEWTAPLKDRAVFIWRLPGEAKHAQEGTQLLDPVLRLLHRREGPLPCQPNAQGDPPSGTDIPDPVL